jgi:predicted small secreted protein
VVTAGIKKEFLMEPKFPGSVNTTKSPNEDIMKHSTLLMIAILACLSASACSNTFSGAGRDIENAGEAVQDAAE